MSNVPTPPPTNAVPAAPPPLTPPPKATTPSQWWAELLGGDLDLGAYTAAVRAFFVRPIDYLPRVPGSDGNPRTPRDAEIIDEIQAELDRVNWAVISTSDLDTLSTRFRESLDEAKKQTEYQDTKATGLLTTISIFGALAGLIVSQMLDNFPIVWPLGSAQGALVDTAYALFGLFVLLISAGAVVVFHANRTRFRYADGAKRSWMSTPGKAPRSRLFYQQISKSTPGDWARQIGAWQQAGTAAGATSDQLGREARIAYIRDYVLESYLVACKTYDKIRYLIPAQTLMFWATRLFVIWVVVLAAVLICVQRDKTAKQEVNVSVTVAAAPTIASARGPAPPPLKVTSNIRAKP